RLDALRIDRAGGAHAGRRKLGYDGAVHHQPGLLQSSRSTRATSVLAPNGDSSRHRPTGGGRTSPAPSGSWAGSSSGPGCCRPTGPPSAQAATPRPAWRTVGEVAHAMPPAPSTGGPIGFGLDAARLPVRFAESCDREDRALAGAMRPVLTAPGEVPALRNLHGSVSSNWQHPVALVAAAATEQGAGNPDGAVERLDAAAQLEQRSPTYYGAAWVALGRIMLTTSLLGECPVAG